MQEIQYDNTERLTANVTPKQIVKALKNKKNRTVAVHNAGAMFKSNDGKRTYRVEPDGSLRRLTKKGKWVRM